MFMQNVIIPCQDEQGVKDLIEFAGSDGRILQLVDPTTFINIKYHEVSE